MIRRDTLETTNGDRFVFDPSPAACRFAGTITDAPEDSREDIGLPIHHVGIAEASLGNEANVLGYIGMGRAGPLTIDYLVKVVGIGGICRFHSVVSIAVSAGK